MEGIAECAHIYWNLLPEWTKVFTVLAKVNCGLSTKLKKKKKNLFFLQNVVKTLVRTVGCQHTLGALLTHTDCKLARQKGQASVPGAGEDGAICLTPVIIL